MVIDPSFLFGQAGFEVGECEMTNRCGHRDEESVGPGTVWEGEIVTRDSRSYDQENRDHDRGESLNVPGGIGFAKHHLGEVCFRDTRQKRALRETR